MGSKQNGGLSPKPLCMYALTDEEWFHERPLNAPDADGTHTRPEKADVANLVQSLCYRLNVTCRPPSTPKTLEKNAELC